jgi:hydroxymethylpyrimidine/phosphomethylpyrimidine kinase
MKAVLSIAGFDTSGGAGIHADVKTARSLGFHACSVITALTFQNTCEVSGVKILGEYVENQLESVLEDVEFSAVKVGVVPDVRTARIIQSRFSHFKQPVVLDPVISSSTGYRLGSVRAYRELMSICDVITPNVHEAEVLSRMKIKNMRSAKNAAKTISDGFSVVVTGINGRDVVYDAKKEEFHTIGRRFHSREVHGTGCVYSTALACFLAEDMELYSACKKARRFVIGAARKSVEIGRCLPAVNP